MQRKGDSYFPAIALVCLLAFFGLRALAQRPVFQAVTQAVSFVQAAAATPQSPQSTVTVVYPAAQSAGDLNVVVVGWNDTTSKVTSVSDSSGNAYTLAVGPTTGTGLSQSIYFAKDIVSGSNQVTVTFNQTAAYPDIRILEYAGLDTGSPLDVTAAAAGNSSSANSGTATTTATNELLLGADTIATTTTGVESGFTSRIITSPDSDFVEDKVVSSTGSYSATASLSSGSWVMQMAAFRIAAGSSSPPSVAVNVSPSSTNLETGATQQFTATVTGTTNTAVTWSASCGTITASGLYTAPAAAESCSVTAASQADTTKSASATVTVTAAPVVAVSMSPGSASLISRSTQQFTANVTGTSNTAVTWSTASGTVTNNGLYTAPATAGTYTVSATSQADTTKSASATITVTAAPVIAVSISPGSASLIGGGTQQFSANVTGTSNSAVTWSSTGGAVTTNGLYTAPATAGTYSVTATSVADASKSASAAITVTDPSPGMPAFVQVAAATPQSPQSTVTVVYPAAQSAGDLNVVVVGWNDTTSNVTSVSDSSGNAYALAVGPTIGTGLSQSIYFAKDIASGSNQVTVTFDQAAAYPDIRILEYAGLDTVSPLDVSAAAAGNSSSASSGPATTTATNELLLGADTIATTTTGVGGGFTSRIITSPDSNFVEDKIVSTTGSYSATASLSSGSWVMQMAAFRIAAGSSSPPSVAVNVSPSSINLETGATQQFTATVTGTTNTAVTWSASCGTITASGLYTAPAAAESCSVTAASQADTTKSASATVTVTAAPVVAVSISPGSASLISGGTQQFTANVTGTSNTAVTWSTTGGTISTGGLYTAPATAGTYTVTATSVADPIKSATASVTVTVSSAVSPTLVQHVSCPNGRSTGNAQASTPDYICPLPEPSQAGNALILGVNVSNSGTFTVSDDKSNTWNLVDSVVDGNTGMYVAVYIALNVQQGTRFIKLHRSTTANNVALYVSEYYNVPTSSAVDTSSCFANSGSTSITAGSITPTATGDLLWQFATNGSAGGGVPNSVSSFTVGSQSSISWQFLSTDLYDGAAAQTGIYGTTLAINPTFTSGTSEGFDSCVVALKAPPSPIGNPPANAFRVVHMLHQQIPAGSPSVWPMQFPTSGNLIILSNVSGGASITGISSTPTNIWSSTGTAAGGEGVTALSQIYYAANAASSNSMTLLVMRTGSTTNDTYMMYDIVGASSSPFDKDSGGQAANETTEVTSLTTCSECLTPTGVSGGNEMIIGNAGWNWCTANGVTAPSGALFDAATDTGNGVNGPQSVDQNNGWFHYYTSAISAITASWSPMACDQAEGEWAARVAAFKSDTQ